ncbi:MAG: DNA repair protein RecO [Acidovorax sp.]|nr:DNA repair protein RecO [Acidovorax sp.]
MATKRVSEEPAFILHQYDWSESSLILECFTRHRGRVALVAKGVKRHTSNFRPVLLALQPLKLHWTLAGDGTADIHTLKGAEWAGGHVMPTGDGLLTGMYVNELLMRLLAREDPYALLFDAYASVVRLLAAASAPRRPDAAAVAQLEPTLRAFELLLLREVGLLPALDSDTQTLQPLQAETHYVLGAETGLQAAGQARASLSGAQWLALHAALYGQGGADGFAALARACEVGAAKLKPQLRALLQYHCGSPPLRTRQLLLDLQSL